MTITEPTPAATPALPDGEVFFGTELQLDLGNCDPAIIRIPGELVSWAQLLAEKIEMKWYGRPIEQHFGNEHVRGWTVIQLIETSNISVHANDDNLSAFVNVFSCRPFDTEQATEFTVSFFGARAYRATVAHRTVPTSKED